MTWAGVVADAAAWLAVAAAGPSLAAADTPALVSGEKVYSRCIGCHAIDSNRTGPQHCGLFGRKAGAAPGYEAYSQALRNSKITWDARALDVFLKDPMQAVPGTTMGYAGIKDDKERGDLITWLQHASRPGQTCQLAK